MSAGYDPLERLNTRRCLEEINRFLLHERGEIIASPGKLSLVWSDPVRDIPRFLAVKPAGDEFVLINGRRFPATEDGLKAGLVALFREAG